MKYARSIVIGADAKSVRQEQQEKMPKRMSQIYGTGEQTMNDCIDRQAAIDAAIKADMENNSNVLSEKRARVIDRHISAVPSAQPDVPDTNVGDIISRQAAIDAIEKLILPQTKGETMAEEINRVAWRCAINCAEEMIRHLPSAEVEPVKHGKWIVEHGVLYGHGKDVHYGDLWHCSECGRRELDVEGWDYCPTCGAKMNAAEM